LLISIKSLLIFRITILEFSAYSEAIFDSSCRLSSLNFGIE
jgi:hypothetical protein